MSSGIIDRGDPPTKKTNHRKVEEAKKEKKQQPMVDAAAARKASASASQNVTVDIYAPCPPNHCNHCSKIMDKETSKPDHMKTQHGCTIKCTKSGCGCYYATDGNLKVHLSRH